jgi:RNase H-fold protein (predicted Holliday junction resolvase)
MRIAALDYGTQRIGVAVANTEVGIAFPAMVLPNDLEQVARWLQQECIERVVIGAPYMLWGEQRARSCRRWRRSPSSCASGWAFPSSYTTSD